MGDMADYLLSEGAEDEALGEWPGMRAFRKVFKPRLLRAESNKGVAMSNTIKGTVEARTINPTNGRHAYKIDGQWYSTFVNEKTSKEAAEVLGKIDDGWEVEFAFSENKGFFNIDGVVSYAQGDGPVTKADYKVGTPPGGVREKKAWTGGAKGGGWKPEDKRPSLVSFAVSYSKDMLVEVLRSDDMKGYAPEAQVKFLQDHITVLADQLLDFMLAKLKDLGYKFPKGE